MTEFTYETYDLPLHITELESPDGFQVWEREMREYLIAYNLWQWTTVEKQDPPTAEIPALAIDGSNQIVPATALAALNQKMSAWKRGHALACNAIKHGLGSIISAISKMKPMRTSFGIESLRIASPLARSH